MKRPERWIGVLALLLVPTFGAGEQAKRARAGAAEPFYRKYLVAGDPLDEQIKQQSERVAAAPEDAGLRNDLGNLLAQRRFPEQAADEYEAAARLDRTNFAALYNLGLLRESEGKTREAMAAYKKSISRKRGFPPSHFRLGRLYEQSGRNDEAVREYADAMRIDPSMRDVKRNPLVAETELLFLASVLNYRRDLATASMKREDLFVDERLARRTPVDRAISSDEAAAEQESEANPAPREVGPGGPTGAVGSEGSRAPARRAPRPGSGGVVGRPRPGTGARPTKMGATPPAAAPAPPPGVVPEPTGPVTGPTFSPPPEDMGDPLAPETVPEPTPTPGLPPEAEPS